MDLLNYADSDSEPEPSNVLTGSAILGKRSRTSSTGDVELDSKPDESLSFDAEEENNKDTEKVVKK